MKLKCVSFFLISFMILSALNIYAGGPNPQDAILKDISKFIDERDLSALETLLKQLESENEYDKYLYTDEFGERTHFRAYHLNQSIKNNDLEVLELFLKYNYPLTHGGARNDGPGDIYLKQWGMAIYNNNFEATKLLLKYNIPFNRRDIAAIPFAEIEMFNYLHNNKIDIKQFMTNHSLGYMEWIQADVLYLALSHKNLELAKEIISKNVYIKDRIYLPKSKYEESKPGTIIDMFPNYISFLKDNGIEELKYDDYTNYKEITLTEDTVLMTSYKSDTAEIVTVLVSGSKIKLLIDGGSKFIITQNNEEGWIKD